MVNDCIVTKHIYTCLYICGSVCVCVFTHIGNYDSHCHSYIVISHTVDTYGLPRRSVFISYAGNVPRVTDVTDPGQKQLE